MASLPELIKKGECDALLIYWYSLLCCEDEVQRNRPTQPFCHKINRWTFECRMDWSRLYPIWCGVCGCDIAILKLRQQIIHATETWQMRTIPLNTFLMHNTCERRMAHTWCNKKDRWAAPVGCELWVLYSALGRKHSQLPRSGVWDSQLQTSANHELRVV